MTKVYLLLFYFLTPLLILYLCHVSKTMKKIGAVVIAYIIGILAGNIGIFPRAGAAFKALTGSKSFLPGDEALSYLEQGMISQSDFLLNQIHATQDLVMTIAIPISIPLLLFSLNLRSSFKLLRSGMLSFVVAVFSLLISITIGHLLFHDSIPESWKISGMMVGLYTGGTPNLAALATALDVQPNLFVLTHTYDLIAGVILLFFFITIAQQLFNKILPHFNGRGKHKTPGEIIRESEAPDNLIDLLNKKTVLPLLSALGITILIFGIGGGLSFLVPGEFQMVTVILTITTLGILVSLIPAINKIGKTFELGMYFILVFCITVASMANLHTIFQIEFLNLFLYVVIAVFGSVLIHVVLSMLFKIDTDSTIITITALSMSPPFVPVVAGALKNKDVIVMGITIGVIGYAIGNYLGISIAYLLKGLM
ncbi:DUF819 family protein [Roseimarinus sediminis]|jgi:uncharacterized membrane protein|uniref:DUF819 family protein n=1 Tax=Roseimarinus sediminis TaxID=1610899 RepID=UPI003D20917D